VGAPGDRLLDRPFRRGIAEAAKGSGGNLISINQLGVDLYIGILIAGVMAHRRDAGDRRRLGRVGAVVGDDLQLFWREIRPSFLKPILTLIFMKTRGRQAGEKFLFAGIDKFEPAYRLFLPGLRQPRRCCRRRICRRIRRPLRFG